MKNLFQLLLLAGLAASLTSCATHDELSMGPPVYSEFPNPTDRPPTELATTPLPGEAHVLDNAPPNVIVSTGPAILVSVDGPPAYRSVAGTDLQRVINTRALLFKDPQGTNYLHLFDGYVEAPTLQGPWTAAKTTPKGTSQVEKEAQASHQVYLLAGTPDPTSKLTPSLRTSPLPTVYVATKPTELITFKGEPKFVEVPGTHLQYATNTTGNVFKLTTDAQTYVLLAGRWFRAPSLNGPWQFVPGKQLPADFAKIPDTSPKENVKASIPGTIQAAEALAANRVPETAQVPRTNHLQAPQFDGPPQLRPVNGTPLHYVINSGTPIIEINDHLWYACQNGVWYLADSLNGPWTVATYVPPVIYTIPPDSPIHYVTYVHVYDSTPTEVYDGYTPGYLGTEVSPDGTVVYGTGYDYAPWVGGVWYGPPVTWGLGYDPCWTPWTGWCFDYGIGWGFPLVGLGFYGCLPPRPWWGPYRHWHDGDEGRIGGWWRSGEWGHTGANIYGDRGMLGGGRYAIIDRQVRPGTLGTVYNSRFGAPVGSVGPRYLGYRGPSSRMGGYFTTHAGTALSRGSWSSSPGRSGIYGAIGPQHSYGLGGRFSSRSSGGFHSAGGFRGGGFFGGGGFRGGGGFHGGGGGFHGGGGFGGGHGGGGGHR